MTVTNVDWIAEKQNGKNTDFAVQKINFILYERGKNRNRKQKTHHKV